MIKQIIFYWVGEKIKIPELLVKSARIIYKEEIKIIQISDELTDKISSVNEVIRIKPTGNLMIDRLLGYSKIKTINTSSLFIDADTLCLNKVNFNEYFDGIYLAKRTSNPMINHNFPQHYPEFENKHFDEVMPYLAGIVLIKNYKNFFLDCYKLLVKEPLRLQQWYGDQFIINKIYNKNPEDFKFFDQNFVYILEFDGKNKNIDLNLNPNNKLLTFKGSTKNLISPIFDYLTKRKFK